MLPISTSLNRTARSLGLLSVGVLSTLGALSLVHVGPAQAQSPGINLAALVAQVNSLQNRLTADEATIAGLQAKTAPLSVSNDPNVGGANTLLTISGVNVQIVNGQGGTETVNGLGNLIVGYDEKDPQFTQNRTGSHNLVVGMGNNYLSYGGLIAGQSNLISAGAPYASITGGQYNVAKSGHASVTGGSGNVASGGSASISGGSGNKASADYASISGGGGNTAGNRYASVSGGLDNTASGDAASVSGGELGTAGGDAASVSGGNRNTAGGIDSAVSGGFRNTAGGANKPGVSDASSVSGGYQNDASGTTASISGGANRNQAATYGWTAGSQVSGILNEYVGNFRSP